MTLSIAWIRHHAESTELVFASDSRLTGGGNVDHCQKIFSLSREDCCVSFAGSTLIAYPFVLQLQNTVTDYKRVFDRAVDVTGLVGRVVALLNRFIGAHEGIIEDDFSRDLTITSFLFGGWSWKYSKFFLWRLYYDKGAQRYVSASTGVWHHYHLPQTRPVEVAIVGDYIPQFFQCLEPLIQDKLESCRNEGRPVRLNYEPLTVLSTMLIDSELTDRKRSLGGLIGGGPQVTKVYPFMRTLHYAVEWDDGPKFVYVIKGRVIADFEIFTVPGINPFTGVVSKPIRGPVTDTSLEEPGTEPKIASAIALSTSVEGRET